MFLAQDKAQLISTLTPLICTPTSTTQDTLYQCLSHSSIPPEATTVEHGYKSVNASQLIALNNIHSSEVQPTMSGVIADLFRRADVPGEQIR